VASSENPSIGHSHVVVVARHGVRLPLKPFPGDTHWPRERSFWDAYGGRLTPVGINQHVRLGERLRRVYLDGGLLLEAHAPDLAARVAAFASNQDRTLLSAQSLLLGMFPDACPSFSYGGDGDGGDTADSGDGSGGNYCGNGEEHGTSHPGAPGKGPDPSNVAGAGDSRTPPARAPPASFFPATSAAASSA
jgi:hypothetical protein